MLEGSKPHDQLEKKVPRATASSRQFDPLPCQKKKPSTTNPNPNHACGMYQPASFWIKEALMHAQGDTASTKTRTSASADTIHSSESNQSIIELTTAIPRAHDEFHEWRLAIGHQSSVTMGSRLEPCFDINEFWFNSKVSNINLHSKTCFKFMFDKRQPVHKCKTVNARCDRITERVVLLYQLLQNGRYATAARGLLKEWSPT